MNKINIIVIITALYTSYNFPMHLDGPLTMGEVKETLSSKVFFVNDAAYSLPNFIDAIINLTNISFYYDTTSKEPTIIGHAPEKPISIKVTKFQPKQELEITYLVKENLWGKLKILKLGNKELCRRFFFKIYWIMQVQDQSDWQSGDRGFVLKAWNTKQQVPAGFFKVYQFYANLIKYKISYEIIRSIFMRFFNPNFMLEIHNSLEEIKKSALDYDILTACIALLMDKLR